ncbi:MAG: hypothetical protein AB1341_14795 [Bacillota bacterium]
MDKVFEKYTAGFGLSFLVTSIFNGLLVIIKENNPPIKDWMQSLFGHHWTTHGVFVIALFIVLGLIFSQINVDKKLNLDAGKVATLTILGVVIGVLIQIVFFAQHI